MDRQLFGTAVLASTALLLSSSGAGAVELLSHRAAYRLELLASDEESGIAQVRGGLVIEWRAGCDGWISNQRLGFVAAATEGPGFTYDVRFSSWESKDSSELRFTMRAYDDGKLEEEFLGQAALQPPAGGRAAFSTPDGEAIDLPPGTIFPTAHMQQILQAAAADQHFIARDVFDGSGLDGLNRVTAVIGQALPRPDGTRRWPVNLAYYELDSEETLPDFQISFNMAETGVLYDIVLDYGTFSLKGEMDKFEELPTSACN